MGRKRKNPEEVKVVRPAILKEPKVETLRWDEFSACVGDPKIIKKMVAGLDDLCERSEIVKLEFVRQFRAFRLFQMVNGRGGSMTLSHTDWINLNELNKLYKMELPLFKGEERNYQRPLKRIWGVNDE